MNTEIYQTGNLLDTMVGSFLIFSSYKVFNQLYILTLGAGFSAFSFTSTAFWSVLILAQVNYLTQTYLRKVYLVSEIELLSNMEEVRIRTILQNRTSMF